MKPPSHRSRSRALGPGGVADLAVQHTVMVPRIPLVARARRRCVVPRTELVQRALYGRRVRRDLRNVTVGLLAAVVTLVVALQAHLRAAVGTQPWRASRRGSADTSTCRRSSRSRFPSSARGSRRTARPQPANRTGGVSTHLRLRAGSLETAFRRYLRAAGMHVPDVAARTVILNVAVQAQAFSARRDDGGVPGRETHRMRHRRPVAVVAERLLVTHAARLALGQREPGTVVHWGWSD